jgi:hypothetical protein
MKDLTLFPFTGSDSIRYEMETYGFRYVGARFGTCFACPPRYDGEIRGRFLAPRDFSLPAHLAGVTAHARPAQRSVPSLVEHRNVNALTLLKCYNITTEQHCSLGSDNNNKILARKGRARKCIGKTSQTTFVLPPYGK